LLVEIIQNLVTRTCSNEQTLLGNEIGNGGVHGRTKSLKGRDKNIGIALGEGLHCIDSTDSSIGVCDNGIRVESGWSSSSVGIDIGIKCGNITGNLRNRSGNSIDLPLFDSGDRVSAYGKAKGKYSGCELHFGCGEPAKERYWCSALLQRPGEVQVNSAARTRVCQLNLSRTNCGAS
jgi:hypothetical protein